MADPEIDEQDDTEPVPPGMTWMGRVLKRQTNRDDRADERVDKWAERALRNATWTVRLQWVVIALLLSAVLVLAGRSVGLQISTDGVSFQGDAQTAP